MTPPRASITSASGPTTASGELSPQEGEARKRVTKACDRCRLKKIKCDGQMPCSRCSIENSVCRYGERKATTERRIPPGYIEYLEEQQQLLVRALRKSYSMTEFSQALSGDEPSVHTILENLGVLSDFPSRQHRDSTFQFEEDLDALLERCQAEAVSGSSASAMTSQAVSAEPTPSRLSPESEAPTGFPFQQSRSQTWSPSQPFRSQPFQPMSAQAVARQRHPSPAVTSAPGGFMPGNASAPSSVYGGSTTETLPGSWQQTPLAQVQSEPTLSYGYWPPTYQPQQWPQDQPQPQPQAEQRYSTVDPAALMLPSSQDAYLHSAEAWAEYLREQERRQRSPQIPLQV